MKTTHKVLLGSCFVIMLFAVNSSIFATAAEPPAIEINGDTVQAQVQSNCKAIYSFRQRTRLTIDSNVNLQLDINCDAMNIGDKSFEIEIMSDFDLELLLTCTDEHAEFGLTTANQAINNGYAFQEGFVISLETNDTFTQARLKIQSTSENRLGTWAYYNPSTNEWVSVETIIEDGYLVTETTHFSTWTVLMPEANINYTPFIIIGVGVITGAILLAVVLYYKKR